MVADLVFLGALGVLLAASFVHTASQQRVERLAELLDERDRARALANQRQVMLSRALAVLRAEHSADEVLLIVDPHAWVAEWDDAWQR